MSQKYLVRRDTPSWVLQVRVAFALSVLASMVGVWNMPGTELDRAFIAVGFLFCLFATFTLAKMVRDNRDEQVDTGAWMMMVWIGFGTALALTAWGLFRMQIGDWERGYMLVAWLFLVSSAFTLAKTLRDQHEADLLEGAMEMPQPPADNQPAALTVAK